MKTYGWQSPEQIKFINENPKVLSLLYDLSILPEEISARVRGIVEDELKESNRLNERLQNALRDIRSAMDAADTSNPRCFGAIAAIIEVTLSEKPKCDHEWAHIEDHHCICRKCNHVADLCWECEKERPCPDHPRLADKRV